MSYGWLSRAIETVTHTGAPPAGAWDLDGPLGWAQSIVAAAKEVSGVGTGPWSVELVIDDRPAGNSWERWVLNVEEGTGGGGADVIRRDTGSLIASSNSGSPVAWGSGVKNVFAVPLSEKAAALFDKLATVGVVKRLSSTSYSILATGAIGEALLDDATAADARTTIDAQEAVITTKGDLVKGGAVGSTVRLGVGSENQVLKVGATSDFSWETEASADVSHSPTSPVTGTTVQSAIDQLSHAHSVTNKTTSQTGISTEVAVTDLAGLSIPGGADSAKKYRCLGQLTFTAFDNVNTIIIRVRVGTAGTTADAEVCRWSHEFGHTQSSGEMTLPIPTKPFVPLSTGPELVTITVEYTGGGTVDIVNTATKSFLTIEQISNA